MVVVVDVGLVLLVELAVAPRLAGDGGLVGHLAHRLVHHRAGIDDAQLAQLHQLLAGAARHGVRLAAAADEHEQRAVVAGPEQLGASPLAVRQQIHPVALAQPGQLGAAAGQGFVLVGGLRVFRCSARLEHGRRLRRRGGGFGAGRRRALQPRTLRRRWRGAHGDGLGGGEGAHRRFPGRERDGGFRRFFRVGSLLGVDQRGAHGGVGVGQRLFESGHGEFVAAQPGLLGRLGLGHLDRHRLGGRQQRRIAGVQWREARGLGVDRAAASAQPQHRVVVAHQRREERLGFFRVLAQHVEAAAQRLQQAGHHLEQPGRLLERRVALDAPQQIGHHRQVAARVELAALVGELGMGDHQRPVLEQEIHHHAGHAGQIGTQAELPGDLVGQRLAFLGEMDRLQPALVLDGVFIVLRLPLCLQRLQPLAEIALGDFVLVAQLAHGGAHRRHEALELFRELVVELEAALRHAFDQPARRVFVGAEEARVGQGHAHQRRLQRHEGLAHRRQHAPVAGHLADQGAHGVQPQHLAHLARLGFQRHQRAGAVLRRRMGSPIALGQRCLHVHIARRTVHRADGAVRVLPARPAGFVERLFARLAVQGRGFLLHGLVVALGQRLVVLGDPLGLVEEVVHHVVRHRGLGACQPAHVREGPAPLGRACAATTAATARSIAPAGTA